MKLSDCRKEKKNVICVCFKSGRVHMRHDYTHIDGFFHVIYESKISTVKLVECEHRQKYATKHTT
jgi:hypothetical protein